MEYKRFKLAKKHKDTIEEWCELLESGEYNQGNTELYTKDSDSYCCLGVYGCHVLNQEVTVKAHGDEAFLDQMWIHKTDKYIPELMGGNRLDVYLGMLNDGLIVKNGEKSKTHTFKEISEYLKTYIDYT